MVIENQRKVGVMLYGTPEEHHAETNQVSGLVIWQRRYTERLINIGLDVIEYYFIWDSQNRQYIEKISDNQYLFYLGKQTRVFFMEEEAKNNGLEYSDKAKSLELLILDSLKKESLDALFVINWISTGMILWQAALRFNKPVIFTPTEHSVICHLGFLLHPSGVTCSGPARGLKCSACTHGVEPFPSVRSYEEQWYSERFRQYYHLTMPLPKLLQKFAIRILAKFTLPRRRLLSEKQARARFKSAKRFLQSDHIITAFQSSHQHELFEKAIEGKIEVHLPIVIPSNKNLQYAPEKDTRLDYIEGARVTFLFAARSSFDRGLQWMLKAWLDWSPSKEKVKLVVRCDNAGDRIEKIVECLVEKGCDIDIAYGKLTDIDYQELHRSVYFVINPAMWEEPLSGSVIESFDLGTPVIAPTRTGSATYIKKGENGYLFEFRSSASLIDCLNFAVNNMHEWATLHHGAIRSSQEYHALTISYLNSIHTIVSGEHECHDLSS